MKEVLTELATSIGVSTGICVAVDTQPLITTLITFGISIITIVGGELIKLLVAYLKSKTNKMEREDKEQEEKEEHKDGSI